MLPYQRRRLVPIISIIVCLGIAVVVGVASIRGGSQSSSQPTSLPTATSVGANALSTTTAPDVETTLAPPPSAPSGTAETVASTGPPPPPAPDATTAPVEPDPHQDDLPVLAPTTQPPEVSVEQPKSTVTTPATTVEASAAICPDKPLAADAAPDKVAEAYAHYHAATAVDDDQNVRVACLLALVPESARERLAASPRYTSDQLSQHWRFKVDRVAGELDDSATQTDSLRFYSVLVSGTVTTGIASAQPYQVVYEVGVANFNGQWLVITAGSRVMAS
jgi:type IV secretory pathway VirB10-like protein